MYKFFQDDNITMPGDPLNLLPIAPILTTLDLKQFEDGLMQMVTFSQTLVGPQKPGRANITLGSVYPRFECTAAVSTWTVQLT